VHPIFKVGLFRQTSNADELDAAQSALLWLLEALVRVDVLYLKTHPQTPSLYDPNIDLPGVKNLQYLPEVSTEEWLDVGNVLAEGGGDCEDLAAWRAAEYRLQGIDAKPFIRWRTMPDGSYRYHALVKLPAGARAVWASWYRDPSGDTRVEDPSANLGMYRYADYLSGKMDKRAVAAFLARRADEERAAGNQAAAGTLRLRARQAMENL